MPAGQLVLGAAPSSSLVGPGAEKGLEARAGRRPDTKTNRPCRPRPLLGPPSPLGRGPATPASPGPVGAARRPSRTHGPRQGPPRVLEHQPPGASTVAGAQAEPLPGGGDLAPTPRELPRAARLYWGGQEGGPCPRAVPEPNWGDRRLASRVLAGTHHASGHGGPAPAWNLLFSVLPPRRCGSGRAVLGARAPGMGTWAGQGEGAPVSSCF